MGRRSRAKAARRQPPKARGTQVTVNGIDWRVDSAPLSGTNFRTTRVARHTADVFVLAPSWGTYIFVVVATTSIGFMGLVSVVEVVNWVRNGFPAPYKKDPGGWSLLLAVISAVLLVVLCLVARVVTWTMRFDRMTGRMTRRVLWRTTVDRPLTDIVVVQCLYAGMSGGGGARGGPPWHEYQLNLAVTDGPGVRVMVCSEPNGLWVRAMAAALAKFLGVPVVDHFAATGAPCDQPRTGVWHWLWNWKRGRR